MTITALRLACVFLGGGLGASLRWLLGLCCGVLVPGFNFGVTIANVLGCFLIGVAASWFERRASLPPEWRLLAITGFLGGFTTFSSFSLEALTLLDKRPVHGLLYLAGKILLCLSATYLGHRIIIHNT